MSFLANDLDTSTTAGGSRFHNVHVFVALHFPLILPPLVILWEYISGRRYIILLPMRSLHFEDIPPQIVLTSQMPSPREVIDLLVLIDALKFAGFDQSGPQYVPRVT